jgi:mono/diheme cytochrome c family protein
MSKVLGVGRRAIAVGAVLVTLAMPSLAAAQSVISGGVVANGKAIAMTWCSACHLVAPAAGAAKASSDVPTFTSIAQMLPDSADLLAAFIANPHPPMPNFNLSRQDIRDLLAYIATLR